MSSGRPRTEQRRSGLRSYRDWSKLSKTGAAVAVMALAAAVTRLPQLLGQRLYPDGDECVVGLMAEHVLHGKKFPIFFYGQHYGLAALEVTASALAFKLFGVSATVLKAAMLALWAGGCTLLAGAANRLSGPRAAALTGLLVLFTPAWAQFSMKASGGYSSAFFFSSLALFLASGRQEPGDRRWGSFFFLGASACVVLFAQPIWLAGLAPFLLFSLQRKRPAQILALVAGAVAVFSFVLAEAPRGTPTYWTPPVFKNPKPLHALALLPHRLWVNLSGAYYLQDVLPSAASLKRIAIAWATAAVFVVAVFCARAVAGEILTARQAAAGAVCATLLLTLAMNNDIFGFRYLLPLAGFLALSLSIELATIRGGSLLRTAAAVALIVLLGSGALALWRFRRITSSGAEIKPGVSEGHATRLVVASLERQGIHYVYSFLPLLQWTLMFESDDTIQARWAAVGDRYPQAGLAVDRALREGKPVALVGTRITEPPIEELVKWEGYPGVQIQWIEGWYWVIPNAPRGLVEKLFTLSPAA